MNIDEILNTLSLEEKIAQMFIMGFTGDDLDSNILNAVRAGLGGIIFFAENIKSIDQTAKLIQNLQKSARVPLFMSIDQEGGLVERTINCTEKIEYLTPMALSGKIQNVEIHTQIMAKELKALNINMDFAPVLDVNTNKYNPIIGIRSFSSNPDEVIKYSEPVYRILNKNNIIAVGKHFPGHGEAGIDSHKDMPSIELGFNQLDAHIKPFKKAIENGLDAIMVAHVHYSAFNSTKIPASMSKEVITDYLKDKLNFKGLIISDDMVMGGIANHYDRLSACIQAINAGIDILIFRDSTDENMALIDKLVIATKNGDIQQERINESVEKILLYKEKYNILAGKNNKPEILDINKEQDIINKIAVETIKIERKGNLIPLDKSKKILVLSPDNSQIHSYAKNSCKISDFLDNTEINYPINPTSDEIEILVKQAQAYETVIFICYNAILNTGQIELFNSINKPIIAIASGIPYDAEKFNKADSILISFGYKTPAIKALANILSDQA